MPPCSLADEELEGSAFLPHAAVAHVGFGVDVLTERRIRVARSLTGSRLDAAVFVSQSALRFWMPAFKVSIQLRGRAHASNDTSDNRIRIQRSSSTLSHRC